jgi:hypothetical protein
MTEMQVLREVKDRFLTLKPEEPWHLLDLLVMRALALWNANHGVLDTRIPLAFVIINSTQGRLQVEAVRMTKGKEHCVFGGQGWDPGSRTIPAGGACMIWCWGHTSTFISKGDVGVAIETAGFTAALSNRKGKSTVKARPGFQVGFLEKTYDDWWAKIVLNVVG